MEIKRIPVGVWAVGIALNYEGTYAYVSNNKTNDISIINMEKLKEEERIEVGIHPYGIAFFSAFTINPFIKFQTMEQKPKLVKLLISFDVMIYLKS